MVTALQTDLLSAQFKALSDPNRLRILKMLKEPGGCCSVDKDKGMCACDIEAKLELSQPTISHHMKVLRDADLVIAEKIGSWMWYRRNERALRDLATALERSL